MVSIGQKKLYMYDCRHQEPSQELTSPSPLRRQTLDYYWCWLTKHSLKWATLHIILYIHMNETFPQNFHINTGGCVSMSMSTWVDISYLKYIKSLDVGGGKTNLLLNDATGLDSQDSWKKSLSTEFDLLLPSFPSAWFWDTYPITDFHCQLFWCTIFWGRSTSLGY